MIKNNRYNFYISITDKQLLNFMSKRGFRTHTVVNGKCVSFGHGTLKTYKVLLLEILIGHMDNGKTSITDDEINNYFRCHMFSAKTSHYQTKKAFYQIINAGIIKPLDDKTESEITINHRKRGAK